MASFKKHFQNFSLQKQQNQEDQLHIGSTSDQPRRSSHEINRMNVVMKPNFRHSTTSDGQMKDVPEDVLSFKSDIFNCLDMCTAYIQALNTLCSTGAVLAQNLTQVFSRDVNVDGDNIVSKSSNNVARLNSGRRRFLGFKAPRGHGQGIRPNILSPNDEMDSNYYEIAEQFLQVWETMSVSTAGASATIKTETLMTLQDILNNLEQESSSDPRSKSDLGNNINLEKSIRAAKTCLLAYIELQAQFSYNSWKSLNHLTNVLKSDPSMTDVVGSVKKHFCPKALDNNRCGSIATNLTTNADQQKRCKKHAPSESNTFDSAIVLLSGDVNGPKRQRKKHSHATSRNKVPVEMSSSSSSKVASSSQFPKNSLRLCSEGVPTSLPGNDAIIKQSTWPGKEAMPSMKNNQFSRTITCDDWSMWPKSSCLDLQTRSNDLFANEKSGESYLLPWSNFSNSSSSSNSTINGNSLHPPQLIDQCSHLTAPDNSQFGAFSQRDDMKIVDRFSEINLRPAFSVPLDNMLDDRTNLSVIELAKKLSSEGVKDNFVFDSSPGYTFSVDPFAPVSSDQIPSSDISRSSKTSTWPMKQANNNSLNGNGDWSTFDTQLAFDSSNNTSSLFGSDPVTSNFQGSSSLWPFDNPMKQDKNQTAKVPTSFNNLFINEANNNAHLNHNFG